MMIAPLIELMMHWITAAMLLLIVVMMQLEGTK